MILRFSCQSACCDVCDLRVRGAAARGSEALTGNGRSYHGSASSDWTPRDQHASLDAPAQTLTVVCRWPREHRLLDDQRPWRRAASVSNQAVRVLLWFKDRADIRILAGDALVSIATGYRYLHEEST